MLWVVPFLAASLAAPQSLGPPPPASVQRLVSLAPSLTEIAFALGEGDRVVGVTRYDDFPPEVASRTRVGGLVDPDIEAIAVLHPDLVLALPSPAARPGLNALARLGIAVVLIPAETLNDMWQAIETVGHALQRDAAAHALTARLRAGLQELRAQPARDVRILVVVGHRPLVVAGPNSFLDDVVRTLGATNVVLRGGNFPVLDLESIAPLRPQVIVDVAMDATDAAAPFWQRQPQALARQAARVESVHDAALLRPGPRIVDAMRRLKARLAAP